MVDLGQEQGVVAPSVGIAADRRWHAWYTISLLAFLIAPGLFALAIMGWLKAP